MSKLIERHRLLKEAIDLGLKQTDNFDGLSSDILTNVVIQTINTYQQKVNVGVQDSVSDLMEIFKQKVSQAIFDAARGWHINNRDPFPFPRGCRFCFTKGHSTIVVIEQDPQIRTLLFDGCMLDARHRTGVVDNAERIALALPYVIFFLHFKDDLFTNLYCGWRTLPLQSMDDALIMPVLPNIHDNMNVCIGHDQHVLGTTISTNCDSVLGNYWNSKFNNDLSVVWWKKNIIDDRLRTARTWAEASLDDSTFILNVGFNYTDRTLKKIVDILTVHDQEPDENNLRHRLSETIDSSVGEMFSKVMRYFKKTKFDKYHPKEVKELVGKAMHDASEEMLDVIFAIQHELEVLKEEVATEKAKNKIVKIGHNWEDYSS